MELELQGWKVKLALVALAFVVFAVPVARAVKSNKDRAEDWHRRAVVAEESVAGLKVVIAERSRALNRRTLQANQLVSRLDTSRTALRRSKGSVGTLTRRQRRLASENARIEAQRRRLQTRHAALERIASSLRACAPSTARGAKRVTVASRVASCKRAAARLDTYLESG